MIVSNPRLSSGSISSTGRFRSRLGLVGSRKFAGDFQEEGASVLAGVARWSQHLRLGLWQGAASGIVGTGCYALGYGAQPGEGKARRLGQPGGDVLGYLWWYAAALGCDLDQKWLVSPGQLLSDRHQTIGWHLSAADQEPTASGRWWSQGHV